MMMRTECILERPRCVLGDESSLFRKQERHMIDYYMLTLRLISRSSILLLIPLLVARFFLLRVFTYPSQFTAIAPKMDLVLHQVVQRRY